MNRHSRKRLTSKISNLLWSVGMTVLILVVGFWVLTNWIMPWIAAMGDAI